jgi:predicted metal-binding membrane protein
MTKKSQPSKASEPKTNESTGAPRWTYVLAAIVGVVTLAWAVVSYFLSAGSKAESPPGITIRSEGDGNANTGVNNGQINIGGAAPRPTESPPTPKP